MHCLHVSHASGAAWLVPSLKGFMIQARDPATSPPAAPHLIGQFTVVSDGAKTRNCDQGGVSAEVSLGGSSLHCLSSHVVCVYVQVLYFHILLVAETQDPSKDSSLRVGQPLTLYLVVTVPVMIALP